MCFYKNLKKYREIGGFSQKQMAELLDIAPSTYSLYESGKREPDVLKIHAIAKILQVSGDLLLFGKENPFGEKNEAMELYKMLDENDKAEIRGEMKQMLKANKYDTEFAVMEDVAKEIKSSLEKNKIQNWGLYPRHYRGKAYYNLHIKNPPTIGEVEELNIGVMIHPTNIMIVS